MLTEEKLHDLCSQSYGGYDLILREFDVIIKASKMDPYHVVSMAYTYGLHRGQAMEKNRRKKARAKTHR